MITGPRSGNDIRRRCSPASPCSAKTGSTQACECDRRSDFRGSLQLVLNANGRNNCSNYFQEGETVDYGAVLAKVDFGSTMQSPLKSKLLILSIQKKSKRQRIDADGCLLKVIKAKDFDM